MDPGGRVSGDTPVPLLFHSPVGHTPTSLATAHSCKPHRAQKRLSEGKAEVSALG